MKKITLRAALYGIPGNHGVLSKLTSRLFDKTSVHNNN